jgi:hypothetical protein
LGMKRCGHEWMKRITGRINQFNWWTSSIQYD